jgi:uncharacterized protein DUF4249
MRFCAGLGQSSGLTNLSGWWMGLAIVVLGYGIAGCDSMSDDVEVLVVESFLEPGRPLPVVRVSRTVPLDAPQNPAPVVGARVTLELEGQPLEYGPSETPGQYVPPDSAPTVRAGAAFKLVVQTDQDRASATGTIPPPMTIDSIRVSVPTAPIAAVLLDSLSIPLDSLGLGLPSRTGFIYPVDVTIWWRPPGGLLTGYWIETSLEPVERFSSALVDFFLLPRSVLEEPLGSREQISWTGLYAVPVARADDPLPPHDLKVSALRSTLAYARFALSSRDPDRREPDGNVVGGIGIVAGIALDSVRVRVQ